MNYAENNSTASDHANEKKIEKYNKEYDRTIQKHEVGDDNVIENQTKKDKEDADWGIDFNSKEGIKWSELTLKEGIKAVAFNLIKICVVVGCLYVFICSISMLGDSFQILAGKSAGAIFANDSFLSNPITGLIIGILVTVLVQSSSTSTSIVITMIAAGILEVKIAIPIIMGTNIGTSVTNTIVALSQSMDRGQFRRAFAAATVHDIFNLLSILVLFPLEVASDYLYSLTLAIVESFHIQGGSAAPDFLKVITDPFVKGIVEINKTVITLVAEGVPLESTSSMVKIWCKQTEGYINLTTLINETVAVLPTDMSVPVTGIVPVNETVTEIVTVGVRKCKSPDDFLFANTGLSDVETGIILFFVSLFLLCFCLILMVKVLNSMLQGSVAVIIKKIINTNFKYPFGFLTGYLAILIGAAMTFLVQSSSVFTSTLTPLVGVGVVSLKRMYPLTLGANIGTTTTGILAALASDPERLDVSLQIALVHLFFNLSGIVLWYPVPFMRRIPLNGAKSLGSITATYRWFAVVYLLSVFFIIPLILMSLSLANFWALMSVLIIVIVLTAFIVIINILQNKRPRWLPSVLRTWKFLPIWLRSLQPYDQFMSKYLMCKCCCDKHNKDDDLENVISLPASLSTSKIGNANKAFETDVSIESRITISQL